MIYIKMVYLMTMIIANDIVRKVKTVDEINNSKNNRKKNNDTRF